MGERLHNVAVWLFNKPGQIDLDATMSLKLGLHPRITDRSLDLLDTARAVEERGLDGIFFPEHTHVPVHYDRNSYPGMKRGIPMPEFYKRVLDPYVASSFVAAATGLEVGTIISLVAQHDPIVLAKNIATIDFLSKGRFVFGVGFGWSPDEFAQHSRVPFGERMDLAREKVAVLKAIWSSEEGAFQGRHVTLQPTWSWPKPAQRPHPPILLGGRATEANYGRICEWADGWIPQEAGFLAKPGSLAQLGRLRALWRDAGRATDGPRVTVMIEAVPARDELARQLARAVEWGVERIVINVGDLPQAELNRILDNAASARPS